MEKMLKDLKPKKKKKVKYTAWQYVLSLITLAFVLVCLFAFYGALILLAKWLWYL